VILKVIQSRKHHLSSFCSAGVATGALGAQLQRTSAWTGYVWRQAPCSEQGISCFPFRVFGERRG